MFVYHWFLSKLINFIFIVIFCVQEILAQNKVFHVIFYSFSVKTCSWSRHYHFWLRWVHRLIFFISITAIKLPIITWLFKMCQMLKTRTKQWLLLLYNQWIINIITFVGWRNKWRFFIVWFYYGHAMEYRVVFPINLCTSWSHSNLLFLVLSWR